MGERRFLQLLVATLISTTAAQLLNCDFEIDLCQWTQVTTDNLDWTRQKSATATNGTGPSNDHTIWSGSYICVDNSGATQGGIAQLQSPVITVQSHKTCFQFWYYMSGSDVANLNVYRVSNNGTGSRTMLWSAHGPQSDNWNYAHLDLSIGTNFVIIFEATTGAGYLGALAIDDVSYFPSRSCY